MPEYVTIQVWKDHATPVGEAGDDVQVTVVGGDTVYYGDRQVVPGNAVGSLTVGQSVTLTAPGDWLRSGSLSEVQLTTTSRSFDPALAAKLGSDGFVGGAGGSPLTASVAVGTSVSGGDTGLVWSGSAWVSAKTLAAPSGMTAQDLLIGASGTAVARVAAGTAGQTTGIRSDGTVGHMDNIVSLAGWKVGANANLGNGSNDDTAAIQAWINAVILKEAKGIAPPPSSSYNIATVNIVPSPGTTVAIFDLEFAPKTWIFYQGASGTDAARKAMFNCVGWKATSKIKGLQARVPTASYVTVFEMDNPATTFAATYTAGQTAGTAIQLVSTANLVVGQPLELSPTTGNDETLTIATIPDATHVTFTTATANAHTTGDSATTKATSMGSVSFEHVQVVFPAGQLGMIGYRLAHTQTLSPPGTTHTMDQSNITWRDCVVSGSATGTDGSTGQIGWVSEGDNTVAFRWYGGGFAGLDRGITNRPTTGSSNVVGTRGALYIHDLSNSSNLIADFDFVGQCTYLISGGRYERGGLFLRAQGTGSTDPLNVMLDEVEVEAYLGISNALIALQDSCSLTISGGYFGLKGVSGTPAWTSSMITMTSTGTSKGSLSVRGAQIAASDPFYLVSSGQWRVTAQNNQRMTAGTTPFVTPNIVAGHFADAPLNYAKVVRSGAYEGADVANLVATVQPANGIPWAQPIVLGASMTVSAMGLNVGTAGDVASTVALCIWADDGNERPSALLLFAGSVSTAATGYIEATGLSYFLPPGRYWIGGITQNVTTTLPKMSGTTGYCYPPPQYTTGLAATTTVASGSNGGSQGNAAPGAFTSAGPTGACTRVVIKAA